MDDHSRTIIHIDIDCFYAQVEMIKNPILQSQPLGIQQKSIVVTSNSIAREYGVKKCMKVEEAKNVCPNLVLVNGENLRDYRQISYKVTSLLQDYSDLVERLGLDENFIDVSNLVNERLTTCAEIKSVGYSYGNTDMLCECGCTERLNIGCQIAQEIRDKIFQELKLTTCAGIAHNKLLAKIVGTKNKPNKQTVVFPNSAAELMLSLDLVKNITWIGQASVKQLAEINIKKVDELQNSSVDLLRKIFGPERARNFLNLSFGRDTTSVKRSGKPQSIGLEDSYCAKAITAEKEIQDQLKQLLTRLMILVKEDGRIPKTIKLTVRKFDISHPHSYIRETRQCNVNIALFNTSQLTEKNEIKLMNIIMTLFRKVVDTTKKFHITLLGLSFTKFVEKPNVKNVLTNFLCKDIEVQSVIDIENKNAMSPVREPSTSFSQIESEYELEPSPKRSKFFTANASELSDSSIKLSVETLRLNSTDSLPECSENIQCPPDANEEVFRALPNDMQQELWEDYKRKRDRDKPTERSNKRTKSNSILNYVVREDKK